MTKGYTLNYFIGAISNVSDKALVSNGVYSAISPRRGSDSVKALMLDVWLGHKTSQIVSGKGNFKSFGKTPRARLLKALRLRKKNGSF